MANAGLFVVPNVVVQTAVSTAGAADTTTPASNAGLFALLPLIGAVLGGVVGGVFGAWANSWYRNREEQKALDEEREGLMILLSIEVFRNFRIFKTFVERLAARPEIDNRPKVAATLQSAVWDESQVRLAQLIPRTHLAHLENVALYYESIAMLRLDWTVPTKELIAARDTERVRNLSYMGFIVIREAQHYISDPEFAERLGRLSEMNTSTDA